MSHERVVEFGPGNRLVGILTSAGAVGGEGARDGKAPLAVVITNAGIIHRVGANRLHVRLARHLAALGIPCFRYDLPGIGDSEPTGTGPIMQENLAATRAAMDRLQSMGVADRFVMVGLCSGADHSFMTGVIEPRVAGALMIDPTTVFSTPRHHRIRALQRLGRGLRPAVAWRILTGRKKLSLRPPAEADAAAVAGAAQPAFGLPREPAPEVLPEARKQVSAALATLAGRPVQLFFFMTGHSDDAYSYRRQLVDAFPEIEALPAVLRVERRPRADHTFSREADRQYLEQQLAQWLQHTVLPAVTTTP